MIGSSVIHAGRSPIAPRSVDKEQKRQLILNAAYTIFIRDGYYSATISSIANEAGVGKGTVYEYFESKESIVKALLDAMMMEYDQRSDSASLAGIQSAEDVIELIMTSMELPEHFEQSIPFFFDALAHSIREKSGLVEAMGDWFDSFARKISPHLKRLQKEGKVRPEVNVVSFSRTTLAALDGVMLHIVMFPGEKKAMESRKRAFRQMLQATLLPYNPMNEST